MVIAKTAAQANNCHDCGKELLVKEQEIENGFLLKYKDAGKENGREISVFKCKECFKANPGLTNFQKCEVYSRIVGYLRPVQQWNAGKQKEYGERQEFKFVKECD